MTLNTESQIVIKIKKARRGTLFFPENFASLGKPATVRKALDRLTKSGELMRIATGMYVRPQIDKIIGPVTPSVEELAQAIAKRDRARIAPTGIYAMNKLGLFTQVPMNIVYLTDGAARKVRIGTRTISFKRTTPKNVAALGQTSKLVIQALKAIGKENTEPEMIKKIQAILSREDRNRLAHDIRLAPVWIRDIMKPSLSKS